MPQYFRASDPQPPLMASIFDSTAQLDSSWWGRWEISRDLGAIWAQRSAEISRDLGRDLGEFRAIWETRFGRYLRERKAQPNLLIRALYEVHTSDAHHSRLRKS